MFNNKTIAILGVDGSGKSTAVDNVSKHFADRCTVTYMGYTRFEDPKIQHLKGRRFSTPVIELLIYRCFWKRYLRGVQKGKVAIFDRYIHEIIINSGEGWYDRIRCFFYKHFFPKPTKMVYLYCSPEVSLQRKCDIPDPEVFKAMKCRFDDYFIDKAGVLCLDSEKLSPEQITISICNFINQSFGI